MGVDAGGDAFKLAEETYRDSLASASAGTEGKTLVSSKQFQEVVSRATAQAERYNARLTEQSRLLTLQGKRIQHALKVLPGDSHAAAILMGKHDDD